MSSFDKKDFLMHSNTPALMRRNTYCIRDIFMYKVCFNELQDGIHMYTRAN